MAEAIETSNEAYETRDQAAIKIKQLKKQDEKEEKRKDEYIQSLQEKCSNKEKSNALSQEMAGNVENVLDEDRQWEIKLQESENKIAETKKTISDLEATATSYEEAFRNIKVLYFHHN